ncbi:MAG: CHC2 zinc finger domain-containing protein [Steroidobacteraceae bacterium]|jgi:DNA primase catalytic core
MARIPVEVVERLKTEISVQRLAEARGVVFKNHGNDLIGRCPFHDDKTPSLVVTPAKNLWHCLGACQVGGTVIDWVMKAEGVSFRHAVELLQNDYQPLAASLGGAPPAKHSTVKKLPMPIAPDAEDAALLAQVIEYYHETLLGSSESLEYLRRRGIGSDEAINTFKLGFANRTLGYRLPQKNRLEGAEIRGRLQRLGVLRETGHEHFNGSLVIPILGPSGEVTEVYGRKITEGLRSSTPNHLYLPGPHRGVWNEAALADHKEIILCEALIDALTFWCAGYHNVTAVYGIEGFTPDHLAAFQRYGTERVLIAYDRDEAGERAAEKLSKQLTVEGLDCYRIQFPKGMDANEYALKVTPAAKSLGLVIRKAQWLGKGEAPTIGTTMSAPAMVTEAAAKEEIPAAIVLPAAPAPRAEVSDAVPSDALPASPLPAMAAPQARAQVQGDEIVITLGDRRYRVRGLGKNLAFDVLLKVNVLVSRCESFHVDTLDLYSVRSRSAFITQAAVELQVKGDIIRHDLGQVLRQLEVLQERTIEKTLAPKDEAPAVALEEQPAALELLKDPHLLDRILADFTRCGVVGEESNKLIAYLAATSRKLDAPLAVMVQSSSAAGKSSLMEAVLAFMPAEDKVQYSAMTGQSLFYMGAMNLKHKILALAEEAGAARASYALKLLQSEGTLSIASTGKDPETGKLVTQEYRVEGPVMIFSTTTAIDNDEELLNRCLTLGVDESREQTRAIHERQRRKRTLDGLFASQAKADILKQHQNAQRLLRPLAIRNPYADALTFPDERTRLRRDHEKYLTLIDTIALLHQHQRELRTAHQDGQRLEYIEVTLGDIEIANRLAHEALGRSLDELSPQTRRLLELVSGMVEKHCAAQAITRADYRFSRRDVREHTSWSDFQVKMHMRKLEELEYVLVHRGGRGQSFVYELLYDGAGRDGKPFLMGLVDVQALECAYDDKKEHPKPHLEHPSSPQGASMEHGRCGPEIAPNPINKATSRETVKKNGKLTSWDEHGSIPSYVPALVAADAR